MKNQYLPLVIILLIAVLLTFIIRDVMDEAVVAPLLYLFWVGRLILLSVPQEFIWWGFLVIAFLITVRYLLNRRRRQKSPSLPPPKEPGRIEAWLKLIRQADQETYYKWQLAQRLRKLTLDALAHDLRLSPKQIRQRLAAAQLDLPPDIQAYLQASRTSFGHFTSSKWRFFQTRPQASPLDLEPEKIAQFLEDRFNL